MSPVIVVLLLLSGVVLNTAAPTTEPNCRYCMMLIIFEICGTDGVTYLNFCELERAICLGKKSENGAPLKKLHFGRCN